MKKTIITFIFLLGSILLIGIGIIISNAIHGNNLLIKVSMDAWVSFAGVIIGGLITLISILFAIFRASNEVRDKEIKDVRPFIVFKPEFNNDFMTSLNQKDDSCHYTIDSTIINVSDKLVNNLVLLDEKVLIYNQETKEYVSFNQTKYAIYTVLLDSREMIKPNDKFSFHTNFLINNYSKNKIEPSFKVITRYIYRDILDLAEYTHYSEYDLSISYTDDGKFFLYYNNLVNRTENVKRIKRQQKKA